jgi:dTDP-4-dehydrorhamnose reductase
MSGVVIGSSGQLASHLKELLPDARFLSRADVDLASSTQLERVLRDAKPTSYLVNAAAYTAVDRAESEPALAWAVNAAAPATMARVAQDLRIPFVHVSTDYVFSGEGDRPWRTDDPLRPVNAYGRTKLAGELAVQTLCSRHWILRTSWVFSEHGANFVKTMLRLAAERPELRVVADQRGQPTYAGDLARLVAALVSRPSEDDQAHYGIHHATGGPAVTWRDFAETIVGMAFEAGLLKRRTPVIGIATSEYPTPAKRPANSVLQPSETLSKATQVDFDWQAGLQRMLQQLRKRSE